MIIIVTFNHLVKTIYLVGSADNPANTGIHPMLFQYWPIVFFDAGPTSKQHWVNAPSSLGSPSDLSGYLLISQVILIHYLMVHLTAYY